MSEELNLIFMGKFPYPYGMAGTKRVQHAIDFLREEGINSKVLVLRQSGKNNLRSGVYKQTPYDTAVRDAYGWVLLMMLPKLYTKAMAFLRENYVQGARNLIYNSASINPENWLPLYYAKRIGYRIVFDIVEDYGFAHIEANTLPQRMAISFANLLSKQIEKVASGIIVISRHLENKYYNLTRGKIRLHYRPISIDPAHFAVTPLKANEMISLFYAGSLGMKDGLPVLLDAFHLLAEQHKDIRLVLTGQGDNDSTNLFIAKVNASPFRSRIEYKGYLDENSYYALLNSADIPCMTRIDAPYAHAGFPFKLGEFLATGKPVVASKVSDVETYLCDRENAMLVKPGSSSEIFTAVEYLLGNPKIAAEIGRKGRELAMSTFDFRAQGRLLLSFLKQL
jgi:glycosyltransferase involved in cell wall biosynthesis